MKLVIDRNIWLRGERGKSLLYRPEDQRMCCVGIYLNQLGAAIEDLSNLDSACGYQYRVDNFPKEAEWLLCDGRNHPYTEGEEAYNSKVAMALYDVNDQSSGIEEYEREARVAALFKQNGVEVEFVN